MKKVLVLILVVAGVALALSPALAQGEAPSQLQQLYWQELAKYYDMGNQYNTLAASYQSASGGAGSPFPGARRMISEINAQGRKVQALRNALEASGEGGGR